VVDAERRDPVVVPLELVVGLELVQLDPERQPPDHGREQLEDAPETAWPVHHQVALALPERERLQHARQAQHVVGMEMRDEELFELDEPDRLHELPLRALATVEQQPITAAPHERGRQPTPRTGRRAGGAEEEDVEVHGPMLTQRRA
jgi:hypothetical protein